LRVLEDRRHRALHIGSEFRATEMAVGMVFEAR
jgi:hypothetical protein